MRHTKIIATIGPASDTQDAIDEFVASGVNIFRLNFSHGSHETHSRSVRRIRDASDRAGLVVGILQDLAGPKIRTGPLAGGQPLRLTPGDSLRITIDDGPGEPGRITTTHAELARSVGPADRLLLDDGRIELRVIKADPSGIETIVVDGGELGERKGINAPGVALPPAGLTAKDIADLKFGQEIGVDLVALSFVRTGGDLAEARELLGPGVPIVAKLERPEAIEHLDDILDGADAVMVARGDLGLEMPLERVPRVQKDVTRRARARGLPVVVATQVLESMRTEPRPTRAEVSDAANAVNDGVDAIMLTGETAVGAFPVRAVQTLDAVIRDAESMPPHEMATSAPEVVGVPHARAICEAAVTLARRGDAHAIAAVTHAGKTARLLAALRPRAPIFAATDLPVIARRLTIFWGVVPLVVEMGADMERTGARVAEQLLARGAVPPGSVVVLVNVNPDLTRPGANFLTLQRLPRSEG